MDELHSTLKRYIDKIKAEAFAEGWNACAKEKDGWIAVSERFPGYGEDVLLSIGRYVNVGYLVHVSDDDGQYNWFYSGRYHPLSEVDAWMPLPKPFEEQEI